MELLSIRLRNVRSFEDVTVPFGPGIVRISGENGAGKSTIVAGLAFAVLGNDAVDARHYAVERRSSDDVEKTIDLDARSKLLRRGAPWGLVVVTFRTAQAPGRVFRLHRVLGKRPRVRGVRKGRDLLETEDAALVVLDASGQVAERLDEGKSTIKDALGKLLDLPGDGLAHAFKRIVAAPQGRLLQAVFEENKERRDVYWKILGVDRYARAAAFATGLGSALEERYRRLVERAVAAAEQVVLGLADAPDQETRLRTELVADEAAVAAATRLRVEAAQARERAAETVARARERKHEGGRLAEENGALVRESDEARRALADAEAAERAVTGLEPIAAGFEALAKERPAREAMLREHARLSGELEAARARDRELAGLEAAALAGFDRRLIELDGRAIEERRASQGLQKKLLAQEAELAALEVEQTVTATERDALVSWLERFRPVLGRLVDAGVPETARIDELARTAPAPAVEADRLLVERGVEVADTVTRLTGQLEAARGRQDGWKKLEARVASGDMCPLLLVACPHPKGKDLRASLRTNLDTEAIAIAQAERALAAALAEQKAQRAAAKRLEATALAHQAWRSSVERRAPEDARWLERWDRERALVGRLAADAPESVRPLVAGLASSPELVPVGGEVGGRDRRRRAPIGQSRLFEDAFGPPGSSDHSEPSGHPEASGHLEVSGHPERGTRAAGPESKDDWNPERLRVLARELEARVAPFAEGALDAVAIRLDAERRKADERAHGVRARRDAALARKAGLVGQLEGAPARAEALARDRSTVADERANVAVRQRLEAGARAGGLEARVIERQALGDVPGEHARYLARHDEAQRVWAELHRLKAVVAGGAAARERLERLSVRERGLAQRVAALAGPVEGGLARALEALAPTLADALMVALAAQERARAHEQEREAALRKAESDLHVRRDRLALATQRAADLILRRERLEKLRAAHDHVVHACSVLRGTSGGGPLAGALFRALADLPARLAERRVREVSRHAGQIYRALAPAETWELIRDPRTYVLALAAPGTDPRLAVREGIAIDDMSGGQQMSAALALHLALVHTYARNCDLLVLDEPTTHLDARRRRALAECLRSLRSRVEGLLPLRQVVVMSHDEAFDALQDHVIHVIAGRGDEPSRISGAGVSAAAVQAGETPAPA